MGSQASVKRHRAHSCNSPLSSEGPKALDAAVHEAQAVGYVWYEALALKDMLEWVGEEAKPALQARYDAVSAPFKL